MPITGNDGVAAEAVVNAERPVALSALRNLQRLIARLNRPTDLPGTLQSVGDGVVEGLGFGVAVVNLVRSDGRLEVCGGGRQ
jgi:hypothetical protein